MAETTDAAIPPAEPHNGGRRTSYQDFFDAAWVSSLFRPLLIALVAASVVAGPLTLLHLIGVPWRMGYVLPFAFAAALEGAYSTLQLGRPSWRDRRGLAYRLGEIAVLLILLRAIGWTFGSGWPGMAEVQLWLREPFAFLDAPFVIFGTWILIAWGLAVGMTGDFLDLALQPDEIAAHESVLWGESRSRLRAGRAMPRSEILARFVAHWTVGGVLLVLCAAPARVDFAAGILRPGVRGLGLPTGLLLALLAYFLAGLLLISQARLAVLRGRWYNQDVEVQPIVLRRWHVNSVLAVSLIGLVAAFLPMGTTSWLSAAVQALLALIMRLGYLVMFLLATFLALLLWPLRFLTQLDAAARPDLTALPQVPSQAEAMSWLPDWLGGAVLWSICLLVAVYFGLSYLAAHGLWQGRPGDWLMRLRYWWRARRARAGAALRVVAAAVSRRVAAARGRAAATLRPTGVRIGALAPRERVRYLYLRMIGHAAEQGVIRPAHRTPSEFAQQLEATWPEVTAEVEALTSAFLAARYDRRPISAGEAQGVQAIWHRLAHALRRRTTDR